MKQATSIAIAQAGSKSGQSPLGAAPRGTTLRLQAKLTVGQPGDIYEREADRVADEMMRMPDPAHARPSIDPAPIRTLSLQRRGSECEDEELQRKARDLGAGHYAPHSDSGRRLLAHELTHVQQNHGARQVSPPMISRQEAPPNPIWGGFRTICGGSPPP